MEDLNLLNEMAAHSRELMVAVLHMLVNLSKGEAGSDIVRCLGRTYHLEALPSKNEVRIWPVEQ